MKVSSQRLSLKPEVRRSESHYRIQKRRLAQRKRKWNPSTDLRDFNYQLDYKKLNIRKEPSFYRVGRGEQGVLLVEPYKSEILPYWKFKDPQTARWSAHEILKIFYRYKEEGDFIGMDMARKFLQMGYTRSRRYANHASGKKYGSDGNVLPYANDPVKAESARVFWEVWKKAEKDPVYLKMKAIWKECLG